MTPEEYLDSLLQSLENNTTTNEASPLVKKVFKDVDDGPVAESKSVQEEPAVEASVELQIKEPAMEVGESWQEEEMLAAASENRQDEEPVSVAEESWQAEEAVSTAEEVWKDEEPVSMAEEVWQAEEVVSTAEEVWQSEEPVSVAEESWQDEEVVSVAEESWQSEEPVSVVEESWHNEEPVNTAEESWHDEEPVSISEEVWHDEEPVSISEEVWQDEEPISVAEEVWQDEEAVSVAEEVWQSEEPISIAEDVWQKEDAIAAVSESRQKEELIGEIDNNWQKEGSDEEVTMDESLWKEETGSISDAEESNEEWKADLDELLAAADNMQDDADVTQYIDNMESADEDLAAINELLKKSDNNEAVQDDMMALLSSLGNDEGSASFEDQHSQENEEDKAASTMAEILQMSNAAKEAENASEKKKFRLPGLKRNSEKSNIEKREAKKKAAEKKAAEKKAARKKAEKQAVAEEMPLQEMPIEDTGAEEALQEAAFMEAFSSDKPAEENNSAEVKDKSQGFLAKLFQILTAEEEEEDTAEGELSEFDEALKEPEAGNKGKNKSKKKKDKKEKKGKKEKADAAEGGEGKAPAGEKKQKKEKKKKEKEEKPKEKSGRILSRRTLLTLIAFCATLLAAIVALSIFLTDYADKKKAREAFYLGDYKEAYIYLYDKNLGESDALILERVRVILELERNVEVYEFYLETGKEAMALDALFKGVQNYGELSEVNDFGSGRELENIYQDILSILSGKYGVSEERAKEIITYDKDTYTRTVYSIVNGTGSGVAEEKPVEGTVEEQRTLDVLPEEEDIIQLETEN